MRVEATCTKCVGRREHEMVRETEDFVWLQCSTCGERQPWSAWSPDLGEVEDSERLGDVVPR